MRLIINIISHEKKKNNREYVIYEKYFHYNQIKVETIHLQRFINSRIHSSSCYQYKLLLYDYLDAFG